MWLGKKRKEKGRRISGAMRRRSGMQDERKEL
jgi:hypothetical protein